MAIDLLAEIDPIELTGFIRQGLADLPINQFQLSQFLPNRNVPDLEYRFMAGGTGLLDAAEFRTFDAEAPIGVRQGMVRTTGELPPISRKLRQSEYDRLRLANATGELVQAVYNDADFLMRGVDARLELARSDALVNGSVSIDENGVKATIAFGRAGGNTVAAGTLWSNHSASTPVTDLRTWRQYGLDNYGVLYTDAIMSSQTFQHLLANAEVRAGFWMPGVLPASGAVPPGQLQGIFDQFQLPRIHVYDAQVRVAGTSRRIVPVNKVILVGETEHLGATFYGITAEAQELPGLQGQNEAGIVAVATKTFDPVAVWTKASAIALPVLANPNLSFCATVS